MLREKDVTLFLSPQASRGALALVGALLCLVGDKMAEVGMLQEHLHKEC